MRRTNLKPYMKLATWCIDLCVSWWADIEPPGWLRLAFLRSAAFRKSRDEMDVLSEQLKRDAALWAESEGADFSRKLVGDRVFPESVPTRSVALGPAVGRNSNRLLTARNRWVVCIAATAAAVTLLLWRADLTSERPSDPRESTIVVEGHPNAVLEDEMHALAKVIETSWDSSEAYIASVSSAIDGPLPLGRRSIGNVVSQRVRSFSQSYGQAVDFVAQSVEKLKPER